MASKWWKKGTAGTAAWDSMSDGTHYDNWFTNSACTSGYRSTALPANGDSLIFTGTTAPSTASPTALSGLLGWTSDQSERQHAPPASRRT